MNTNITNISYKFLNAQHLLNKMSNTPFFVFVGDHLVHANVSIQPISFDTQDTLVTPYVNMIMGKQIANTNLNFVITNIPYVANTVFAMYDDQDTNLNNEQFYCITNEGTFYHIWKCLDNNLGAPSTVQPSYAAGVNTILYQTSDGYRWKYMTSIDNGVAINFATPSWFPIVANTSVANQAINGGFDIISIQNQGAFYNNYVDGTFKAADILINGNPTLFNISNSAVSTTNGYYTGCLLYITSGTGQGQFATITDYISNTSGNIFKLAAQFPITPQNGSTYEIRPQVNVTPIGCIPTINCIARALVNSTNSNSIFRIEVLQRGLGYIQANAVVTVNNSLTISNTAQIRPINSPIGGHGSNQYEELYCSSVEIYMSLSNSENGTILTSNFYQEIGIVKDPLFANINFQLINNVGNFVVGEQVFGYSSIQIATNCAITLGQTNVTCSTANFPFQLAPGKYVYLTNQGGTLNQLATVNTVINSTAISLNSTGLFTCTAVILSLATVTCNAYCTNVNSSNNIFVTNASALFGTSNNIIGLTTGASGTIASIVRNGVTKPFRTFIELYKYNATLVSGAFIPNEQIVQGSNSASLFSFIGSTLYASNLSAPISNGQVMGVTSGAIATITQTYVPEIVYGSGKIMYLENINQVPRVNNQTETFQIVLNF